MSGKFKSWCDSTIPTHPHSIPEAKQSLAPPHPAKGRRGFLEKQGMREGVSVFLALTECDSVLRVGPFAGRFAWLCVMSMWNYYGTETRIEKGKMKKRNWDFVPGFLEQENLELGEEEEEAADGRRRQWPCFACLPRVLGCEWWKLERPAADSQSKTLGTSYRRHSTAQH